MAGRFAYVLVAGAALVGGMYFQGDLDSDDHDVRAVVVDDGDRAIDDAVDAAATRTDHQPIAMPRPGARWSRRSPNWCGPKAAWSLPGSTTRPRQR